MKRKLRNQFVVAGIVNIVYCWFLSLSWACSFFLDMNLRDVPGARCGIWSVWRTFPGRPSTVTWSPQSTVSTRSTPSTKSASLFPSKSLTQRGYVLQCSTRVASPSLSWLSFRLEYFHWCHLISLTFGSCYISNIEFCGRLSFYKGTLDWVSTVKLETMDGAKRLIH